MQEGPNIEEIIYKELTDKTVDFMLKAFEGTNITIKRVRDLTEGFPGAGYTLRVFEWPTTTITSLDLKINLTGGIQTGQRVNTSNRKYNESFFYFAKTYKELYRRLIKYKAAEHFFKEDMSPEEVELQLAIRGY